MLLATLLFLPALANADGCSTAYGTIDGNGHLTVPNTVTAIGDRKLVVVWPIYPCISCACIYVCISYLYPFLLALVVVYILTLLLPYTLLLILLYLHPYPYPYYQLLSLYAHP